MKNRLLIAIAVIALTIGGVMTFKTVKAQSPWIDPCPNGCLNIVGQCICNGPHLWQEKNWNEGVE